MSTSADWPLRASMPVESIAALPALYSLRMDFAAWLPGVSLAPLVQSTMLGRVRVDGPLQPQHTDALLEQIRAMPSLDSIIIPAVNAQSLVKLLREPTAIQWEEIGEVIDVDEQVAALICRFPTSADWQRRCAAPLRSSRS